MFILEDLKMLKKLRIEGRLTQRELARRAQTTQSTIAKIEAKKLDPSMKLAERILGVLNEIPRSRLNAEKLMESNLVSFSPSKPLSEAIGVMRDKAFSQVPVVQGVQILGTVTESSIISKSMGKDVSTLKVNDVMVDALPTLPPISSIKEIYTLLKYHQAILVLSKGMLLGIITKADLMHHLLENKIT
jgi:predicted transcriptional regulator